MNITKRLLLPLLMLAVLIGGCAAPESAPKTAEPWPDENGRYGQPPVAERRQRMESQPLKHLANRTLTKIPDRPLNVKANCNFRDPTGYNGRLDLQVKDDDVRRFSAQVNIPKRGSCRFDMKDFRQAEKTPVALATGRSDCAVRMWEQEGRVTVAFRDCQLQCSGDAFDYVWPILVDAKTGKCS